MKTKRPPQPSNITITQQDDALLIAWRTPAEQMRQQQIALVGLSLVLGTISLALAFAAADGRSYFSAGLFLLLAISFGAGAWKLPTLHRKITVAAHNLTLQRDGNPAIVHSLSDIEDVKHGKASIQRGVFLDVHHTGLVEFMHSLSEDEARFIAYTLRQALFTPTVTALVQQEEHIDNITMDNHAQQESKQ